MDDNRVPSVEDVFRAQLGLQTQALASVVRLGSLLASETAPLSAWQRLMDACLVGAAERVRREFHPDEFPNSSETEGSS